MKFVASVLFASFCTGIVFAACTKEQAKVVAPVGNELVSSLCVIANSELDSGAVAKVCNLAPELLPVIEKVIFAHKGIRLQDAGKDAK